MSAIRGSTTCGQWVANSPLDATSFQWQRMYRGADKSLVRPGRKQARKHVRDECDFGNMETRAVIKFFFLQGKVPKEIHAILTETLQKDNTGET